jgi:osmotically-inducible protein OsmY
MIRSLVLLAAAGAAAAYLYSRQQRPGARRSAAALPDDRQLEERIRTALADIVADPGAIHVSVHRGAASVRGPVLPGERDRVLTAVLDVPGVLQVANHLEPVEPAGSMPT